MDKCSGSKYKDGRHGPWALTGGIGCNEEAVYRMCQQCGLLQLYEVKDEVGYWKTIINGDSHEQA